MSDPIFVSEVVGSRAKRREVRMRRRRMMQWGAGAAAALVVVVALATYALTSGGGDGGGDNVRADQTPAQAALQASRSATTAPSTTVKAAPTTTTVPADPRLKLKKADMSKPAAAPIAHYRDGKLYLEGSVPSIKVAAGYLKKAIAVVGTENVVVRSKLDPRAPAGPGRVVIDEQFDFPTGSAQVDPKFDALLGLGVYTLKKIPEARLVLTGYTDNVGDAAENMQLSEVRAQQIVDYMVAHGIPKDRISALGRGELDPIASNDTPEGRARNRRIEGSLEGIEP